MKTLTIFGLLLLLNGCVTKAKYEDVLHAVKSKEKQQLKLNTELEKTRTETQKLRDSALYVGG